VNLLPAMASTYWWRGQIEQADELLLVIKTRQDLLELLTARVRALHSYTVPEVIAPTTWPGSTNQSAARTMIVLGLSVV
jgi:uncharacterized protein involved in tolerance to divalent cations